MSTYVIKWLKDKLGTRFFPVTHINAVRDDTGTSLASMLEAKQDTLVSGTNIKTVNNNSLVGSGNVSIATGDTNVIETVKVNNAALTPDANKAVNISAVTSFNGSTGAVTYTAPVTSVNGETGAVTLSIPSEVTESTVSGWGFTKNVGTITGITMNGASKGTSGVVNLGTVITAHQDISGKADKSTTTTAGTYKSVTVNSSGIVTGGSNPTTLAGYGITDAYTKSEVDDVVDDYLPLTGGTLTGSTAVNGIVSGYNFVTKFLADTSELRGLIWHNTSNSTIASMLYYNTTQNIILNPIGSANVDVDAVGKYSLFVGNNKLTYNTYPILHSNNYDSYALPLTGGTLSGSITLNSSTETGLYIERTNYGKGSIGGVDNSGLYFAHTLNSTTSYMYLKAGTGLTSSLINSTDIRARGYHTGSSGDAGIWRGNNVSSALTENDIVIRGSTTSSDKILLLSQYVGIGTNSPSQKLHVNGVVKCTSVDTSSDERMKNKVGNITINVEDIAKAPNVTFKWKEGEDTENIHGGTFAQYWEKITPYYVHGDEEKSMDYASLSLSCAIELAKEVVQLKEENAMLKQELAEIREMLKKLL